jgi:LAO/AO transport system kinase
VNKADRDGVAETVRDLEMMLDLSGHTDWRPKIVQTVATRGEGIDELWDAIGEHRAFQEQDGRLEQRREARLREELRAIVRARIEEQVVDSCRGETFDALVGRITRRELDPHAAAAELLAAPSPGGTP